MTCSTIAKTSSSSPGHQRFNGCASNSLRFHQNNPTTKNGMKSPWPSSAAGLGLLYASYIHENSEGVWM